MEHFLADLGARSVRVSGEAMSVLKKSRWPGNIRALRNCVERAVIALEDAGLTTLRPEHIQLDDTSAGAGSGPAVPIDLLPRRMEDLSAQGYQNFVRWSEQLYFDHAYVAANKNKSCLSERLNFSRGHVHQKLKTLGIGPASEGLEVATEKEREEEAIS